MILLGFEELAPFDDSHVPSRGVRHPVHPNKVPVA
jgi:hypothetical protein